MTNALYILTEEEKIRLAGHEEVIDDGLNTFHKVGMALLDIRDNRLYRQNFRTFEHYCQERWGMSDSRARQLMLAVETADAIKTVTDVTLPNEATTRALRTFPVDYRPVIAKAADATSKALNKPLTAGMIERVGEVIVHAAENGAANVDGEATPLTAELSQTEYEAVNRQNEYTRDSMGRQKPKTNRAGDENEPKGFDVCQTPPYALEPLFTYLNVDWVIWEPARGEGYLDGALFDKGFSVVTSDIITGQNFFEYTPVEQWDCLVTNPPYSIKYEWLERCYELGKPFALLLPVETLGAQSAQSLFREYGTEVIFLDRRVNFKMPIKGWEGSAAQFPVAWFTWGFNIGKQMVFARMPR